MRFCCFILLFLIIGLGNIHSQEAGAIPKLLEEANQSMEEGSFEAAISSYQAYLQNQNPQNKDEIYFKIAQCYLYLNEADEFFTFAEEAIKANPQEKKYYLAMIEVSFSQKLCGKCLEVCDKFISLFKDNNLAARFFKTGCLIHLKVGNSKDTWEDKEKKVLDSAFIEQVEMPVKNEIVAACLKNIKDEAAKNELISCYELMTNVYWECLPKVLNDDKKYQAVLPRYLYFADLSIKSGSEDIELYETAFRVYVRLSLISNGENKSVWGKRAVGLVKNFKKMMARVTSREMLLDPQIEKLEEDLKAEKDAGKQEDIKKLIEMLKKEL